MPFLIDGYNLLYALGQLTPQSPRRALDGARRWLFEQLHRGHDGAAEVTVIFDARSAPPGVPPATRQGHVRFEFAVGQTADDLIEDRIEAQPHPRQLSVVSDDHRVQQAARRRGCAVIGCLDYYERFLDPRRSNPVPPPVAERPDKPEHSSPEETQRWLDAFGETDGPPW